LLIITTRRPPFRFASSHQIKPLPVVPSPSSPFTRRLQSFLNTMAPQAKSADARRKSSAKPTLLVTLKVSPDKLRDLVDSKPVKEDSPVKSEKENINSPAADTVSVTGSQPPASNSNGDNASDSNAATPAADATPADGTPAPSAMGPPVEGPKKKGVKRSAANANGIDGVPKPRGKPGPKKKPRL
jgi:hypothetical protein